MFGAEAGFKRLIQAIGLNTDSRVVASAKPRSLIPGFLIPRSLGIRKDAFHFFIFYF